MQRELREHGNALRESGAVAAIHAARCDDDASLEPGTKKIHLIRHGQGRHNVAQAEWLAAGRPGEPYWTSTDPDWVYLDAELTPLGEQQARDLRPRTAGLRPELLVVSPMRRAIATALLAFEDHVSGRVAEGAAPWRLPVLALEACHEHAGRHTCDKRLPTAELAARYPAVDFSLLEAPEDPFWGDGSEREALAALARRAADAAAFLLARPERHIAVAAHSTLLAALVNAALLVGPAGGADTAAALAEEATSWFKTGEMRSFIIRAPHAAAAGEL